MQADPDAREGDWLVALHQQAGRGRQGRPWIAGKGNFYGSTLIALDRNDPQPSLLSLAAGLALVEAIDLAGHPGAMLKWPNDVLLGGAKLAGILLERSGDRIVAGFGVNLAVAPDAGDRRCASLGGAITPEAFAPLLAGTFDRMVAIWRIAAPGDLARAWTARAHPPGTRLTVHEGTGERVSGTFAGVEDDGALRLATDDGGLRTIRAGDVEL